MLKKDGETLTLQRLFPAKHYGQGFDETTSAVAEMLKAVGAQVVIKLPKEHIEAIHAFREVLH